MAESDESDVKSNVVLESVEEFSRSIEFESAVSGETLLRRLVAGVLSPPVERIRASFCKKPGTLPATSRSGSHLLVISVGTITLLALTGMLIFVLYFLAAMVNAIIIAFLMSLAAAGGFVALFFACVNAIYIGELSVAIFVICITAISTNLCCHYCNRMGWIFLDNLAVC